MFVADETFFAFPGIENVKGQNYFFQVLKRIHQQVVANMDLIEKKRSNS
jgi:hypothetical protein